MRGLALPQRFVGTGYFLLELAVQRTGDVLTMLLDTGLTAAVMLTPRSCERLGLKGSAPGGWSRTSIGATSSMSLSEVRLDGAELVADGGTGKGRLPLRPLDGVIADDFIQKKIGEEQGVQIDGMLGQGFLAQCDLELDGHNQKLRAWAASEMPDEPGSWRQLPALTLPGDLHGLLLAFPDSFEPVVGIVDSGASHTVLNQKAAYVLGVEVASAKGRTVRGIGLDGSVLEMPLVTLNNATLSGVGGITLQPLKGDSPRWMFGNTGSTKGSVGPLGSIDVGVGDISFFQELLTQDSGIGAFDGPALLLGQDLLAQHPWRISSRRQCHWFKRP